MRKRYKRALMLSLIFSAQQTGVQASHPYNHILACSNHTHNTDISPCNPAGTNSLAIAPAKHPPAAHRPSIHYPDTAIHPHPPPALPRRCGKRYETPAGSSRAIPRHKLHCIDHMYETAQAASHPTDDSSLLPCVLQHPMTHRLQGLATHQCCQFLHPRAWPSAHHLAIATRIATNYLIEASSGLSLDPPICAMRAKSGIMGFQQLGSRMITQAP